MSCSRAPLLCPWTSLWPRMTALAEQTTSKTSEEKKVRLLLCLYESVALLLLNRRPSQYQHTSPNTAFNHACTRSSSCIQPARFRYFFLSFYFTFVYPSAPALNSEEDDVAKAIALSLADTSLKPSEIARMPLCFWHYNGLHPPGVCFGTERKGRNINLLWHHL